MVRAKKDKSSGKSINSKIMGEDFSTSKKVLELKEKIRDDDYVDGAIQRIAQVISQKLVDSTVPLFMKH